MHDEEQEWLLHRTDQGFVRYCACCDHFQVGLGNAVMVLDRTSFNELHDSLLALDPEEVPESRLPNGKTHLIKTSCQSFAAMDLDEVEELQELLDHAMAGLQVNELLENS
jgi:hypothetical protein